MQKELGKREKDIYKALKNDLSKSGFESMASETVLVEKEIAKMIKMLPLWNRPHRTKSSLINFPSKDYILPEPYGKTLIISPWNYPFQLSVTPLVGAVAAGPVGIVPGVMAAKALQEGGEKLIGASKDRPLIANPLKQESVVGNVVLEGVSTIVGGKTQVKLAEYAKKIGGVAIDSSYPKLKKFLQRTVDKIKPQSKLAFIEEQSQKISEALGIPSKAIKRVFERSPKKVLKDSFQVNQEMSKASIDRVSESFERVMSKLSDEFENKVSSQFKASDAPVDIDDIYTIVKRTNGTLT